MLSRRAPLALLVLLGLGCHIGGSGSGNGSGGPSSSGLQPGKYYLSISLQPKEGLEVPVSGGDLTLALPAGATVETVDSSGRIPDASLPAGKALPAGSLTLGRLQETPRQARILFTAAPAGPWKGECVRLLLTLPSAGLTQADLLKPNTPLPAFSVVGLETGGNHETVTLTPYVEASVSVVPAS
jgi:hypothetical protein